MKKSIGLNFRGVRTVYRGEVAEFPVEVAPVRMDAARAARLARELSRRLGSEVVLGDADITVYVGKSAQVPFLGLAEGNGQGSAAFVNLDESAGDELLLEVAAHEAGHLLGTVRHAGEGLAACAFPYTNPNKAANYHLKPAGTDPGAVIIASDTMWPTDPYARQFVISANTVVGTIVESGGQLYLSSGAVGSNVSVYGGGGNTAALQSGLATVIVHSGSILRNVYLSNTQYRYNTNIDVYNTGVISGADVKWGRIVVRPGGVAYDVKDSGSYYLSGYGSGGEVAGQGEMVVLDGGSADDVAVKGGGLYVRNSGTVRLNTEQTGGTIFVSAGGTLYLTAGAKTTNLKVYSATGIVSANGAVISNVTISGGYVRTYDGTVVSGADITNGGISAGGYVNEVTINAGTLWLFANGSATNVTVKKNASFQFWQGGTWADNVTVAAGATVSANATGNARNFDIVAGVTVKDTNFNITWGGANTNIAAGVIADYGADFYAENGAFKNVDLATGKYIKINSGVKIDGGTVAGGGVYVYDGGDVDGTVIGSGGVFISSGATGSNVVASSAGGGQVGSMRVYQGGYASKVSATSGGYVLAIDGGVIDTATLLDAGLGYVSAGGTFNDTVVNGAGANLIVSGTANRTALTAGNVQLRTGGVANGLTAHGGTINVSNNGRVNDLTADAGTMFISNGGSASGVVLTNNGSAEVSAGGTMTDLKISNAGGAGRVLLKVYGGTVVGAKFGRDTASLNGAGFYVSGGGTLSATELDFGYIRVYKDGLASGGYMSGGNLIASAAGARITDFTLYGGGAYASAGLIDHLTMSNGTLYVLNGTAEDITMSKGAIHVSAMAGTLNRVTNIGGAINVSGGTVDDVTVTGGTMNVSGGTVTDVTVGNTGLLNVLAGNTVENVFFHSAAYSKRGGLCIDIKNDAVVSGFKGQTWGGNVYVSGTLRDVQNNGGYLRTRNNGGSIFGGWTISGEVWASAGGTVSGHTLNGSRAEMYLLTGGVASDTVVDGDGKIYLRGGNASNTVIYDGIAATFQNEQTAGGAFDGVTLSGGLLHVESGAAMNVTATGGTIEVAAGATITGLTAANTEIDINFTGVETPATAMIDSLANVEASTVSVSVYGIGAAGTYALAGAGSVAGVEVDDGLYAHDIATGGSYTNAAAGLTYAFDGTNVTATAFEIAAKATAAALSADDTALNISDRAAKWDATTTYSESVSFANDSIAGDAWLVIDGTDVSSALYGAAGTFAHTVNIAAKSGTIRNLAAGAAAGGSVAAVNLTLDGADLTGVAYAGGFGSVTGNTNTLITAGEFTKDFYAGALANKNAVQTNVGDVSLAVTDGTFSGNIYGASGVKTAASVGNGLRHTAGDVTLTVAGGAVAAAKKANFCAFAGGYATGDATGTVYTVNSVEVAIDNGIWTGYTTNDAGDFTGVEAHGGRGVFGGVMASGVTAEVLDAVNITVTDGVIGNIYGGGWAQKGGSSIVTGDVTIVVEGGAVANIFGGGAHSTTGGTTSVNNVDITVRGATVTGAIYAKGQLDGDSVTGTATVTVSGNYRTRTDTRDTSFAADIFGYSYVGGAGDSEALNFADFNGYFTGGIGGFQSVNFKGDTQMKFDTAAGKTISNTAWNFDVTERFEFITGDPILTWETGADFTGSDTIKLTVASGQTNEWSLISGADAAAYSTAANAFAVEIAGGDSYSLTFDAETGKTGAIGAGEFAGWGFELEDSVLKFKNLA